MSFNHLSADSCTYSRNLKENMSILNYVLSPYRYERSDKCFHQLGLVGGSGVSHVNGNLVDLESDLRGQTRYLSKCQKTPVVPDQEFVVNDKTAPIDKSMRHLPTCQMFAYPSVPMM